MKWFNSFQLTACFAAAPLLIQWLHDNGYSLWGWITLAAYVVGFIFMTVSVRLSMGDF